MHSDSAWIIIFISLLVILSYVYSAISLRTKIPSVLLLMFTGVIARVVFDSMHIEIPFLKTALEFLGIVGLILIVLEGALDLRLKRDKLWLMLRSFLSALVILVVSSLVIAYVMHLFFPRFTYYACLINAIPFAVISSAIAIPSVSGINKDKKEFIIYESIFSDILGILFFNTVLNNPDFQIQSAGWLLADFMIVISVSVLVSGLILLFIDKTTMNIKFFLMIAIMVLLYTFGKMIHLSSLLMILIFGIILNNLDLIPIKKINNLFNVQKLHQGIDRFKLITNESAFLIRTFFFFVFGFTLQVAIFGDINIIISGLLIVAALYFIRYLYLRFLARRNLFPELYVAPRGLITILLYYSIPSELSEGLITEGVLFVVIFTTSIIMMIGLIRFKEIPELEIFVGGRKLTSEFPNNNNSEITEEKNLNEN